MNNDMITFDDFYWLVNGWQRDDALFGEELFDLADTEEEDEDEDIENYRGPY